MQNGESKTLARGDHELSGVKSVHHDKVGYIFPAPAAIRLSNQEEKGRWSDITDQKNISTEVVTKDVFKIWFDHGKSPDSASYEYIVVPDVTAQHLGETSDNNRGIEILANNTDIQGVMNTKLGICQLAFYRAGEIELSKGMKIRMDSPGMAMLKMNGDKVTELTVSDPSRKLSRIMVTLTGNYDVPSDQVMSVTQADAESTLIIADLPQDVYAGKSVTFTLK